MPGITNIVFAVVFISAIAGAARADEFDDARVALCEKTKACALQRVEADESMTEQMKEMTKSSLENICAGMEQTFDAALRVHELYEPALACMQDMAEMDCDTLMNEAAERSQACQHYRALAGRQ